MENIWNDLQYRLLRLEAYLNNNSNLSDDLTNIRNKLNNFKPLMVLISKLNDCNVDYNHIINNSIIKDDNHEQFQMKEVILNSYEMLESCINKIEIILVQYNSFSENFKNSYNNLNNSNNFNLNNLLNSYKIINDKFINILQRLIKLFEQRTILKYKQQKLINSINSLS